MDAENFIVIDARQGINLRGDKRRKVRRPTIPRYVQYDVH